MLTIKNYVRAASIEEAYELNQKKNNRVMGGMMWLRTGSSSIDTIVDLSGLGLDKIEETEDEFRIGAMVTLRQLEKDPALNNYSQHAVEKAVKDIVGVQFRNSATVGGSIYGRYGFSDVLTVFMAMDSYVELHKGGIVSLNQYAQMKYDRDLLLHLIIKKKPAKFAYLTMRNQRTDFPVLTVAVSNPDGEYRAVVGARPGKAVIIKDESNILAAGITQESADAFAKYVSGSIKTCSNIRGSEKYRKHLACVLTSRAVMEIGGEV